MSKLSKRDSILLLVFGLVAVLGGIYWFYVKPAKSDLTAKKQATREAQEQVTQLQGELAKITVKATRPSKPTPIADELRLAKAYPYSEDVPVLILQIEDVAKQTHVKLGDATPADGTDYAGVTGTPFTIDATGTFFEVQDFLYRLHNRVRVDAKGRLKIRGRLLAVTKADLSPSEGDQSGSTATPTSANTKVKASVTIVAFSRTGASAGASSAASAVPTSNNSGGTAK